MGFQALAEQIGNVDPPVFVTFAEFNLVGFVKQAGIKQNGAIAFIRDPRTAGTVLLEKCIDGFLVLVVFPEPP